MIAEIYGKISSTGSNLSDRLEDKLTGDIFGTLRYLPFDLGIGPILSASHSLELSEMMAENASPTYKMFFWPYHPDGELDVRIDLDNAIIGIEVKYQSSLSTEDEADYSSAGGEGVDKVSVNQLSRESRIVREVAGPNKKAFLILVAGDKDCADKISDVTGRNLIEDSVELAYISWQEIMLMLERQQSDNPLYTCILEDMVALLRKKGFERFCGFTYPVPDIHVDGYFSYQSRLDYSIQLPEKVTVDCGVYYEFG